MIERYAAVADAFNERVAGVPEGRWQDPAPCEGWVALDVVRHLGEWAPGFFATWDVDFEPLPDEPLARWQRVDGVIRLALADPNIAERQRDTPMGPQTFAQAVATFFLGDVLVHTWDLARATGQDEALDPVEVHLIHQAMQPADEVIRGEHFGPKVTVPDDADEQTKLLAFVGRTP
ncbi:MAG TPA: TIGR03086 family metal-binding protein [Acidimicrobiia bacterium]|nr:TIGR03086 family metal-binding protein [Acidimicrobiia bacterium]